MHRALAALKSGVDPGEAGGSVPSLSVPKPRRRGRRPFKPSKRKERPASRVGARGPAGLIPNGGAYGSGYPV